MTPLTLVAVDPGLDGIGLARFDLRRLGGVARKEHAALAACTGSDTVTTDAAMALPERLNKIMHAVASYTALADTVLVEVPQIEGQYGRHGRGARRGVNRLYMGIGAVLAGAWQGCEHVRLVRAGIMDKGQRHAILRGWAEHVPGFEWPVGSRGGAREDEWDAIWIGWWGIMNGEHET